MFRVRRTWQNCRHAYPPIETWDSVVTTEYGKWALSDKTNPEGE
jgi:hypothetical protein